MDQTVLESPAIVLNYFDHGESDKIVTFFCQNIGILTGIAKGANRSKKRFVNKLEIFTFLSIFYQNSSRNSLAFIHSAEHIDSFLNIRKDIHLYSCGEFIREFVLLTSREMSGDEGLFELILWSLRSLDKKQFGQSVLSIFLIRLLDLLGYRPSLSTCSQCRQPLSVKTTYRFHYLSGALFCGHCQNQQQNLQALSHGTIKFLHSARNLPLGQVHRLRPSRHNIQESITVLHKYVRNLFQKDIHSWKILTDIVNTS